MNRIIDLIETRKRIDAELASLGVTFINGEPMLESSLPVNFEDDSNGNRLQEYIDYQRINVGLHMPGWKDRLGKMPNGDIF